MKDARSAARERFAHYARSLADQMGLRDWTVSVSKEFPDSSDALASIHCCEGRKHATIRLSMEFLEDEPAEQRQTLCHELVHCHFAAHRKVAEKLMGSREAEPCNLMLEYGVDAVAESWATHLPLPGDDAKPTEGGP